MDAMVRRAPITAPRAKRRGAWPTAAIFGITVVMLVGTAALLAPLSPHAPDFQDYDHIVSAPTLNHWFGTDNLGRDIFSRVLYGGRISLTVGLLVTGLALVCGTAMGLAAGFYGGWLNRGVTAISDTLMAFPTLLLAIALAAAFGQGLMSAVLAIAIVEMPRFARVARAQVLLTAQLEYVSAAKSVGASRFRILALHVFPNSTTPIIVQASLTFSFAILAEASLSYLGLSVPPPTPTWGFMLNIGRAYVETAPWMAVFPGLAISLAVLGFNVLGDVAHQVLNPRSRRD